MKKQIVAILTVILMLFTTRAFAVSADNAPVPTMIANAGSLHVDGVLKGDLTQGEFDDIAIVPDTVLGEDIYCGASWGADPSDEEIYCVFLEVFAVKKNLSKVSVKLGGAEVIFTEGAENADLPEGVKYAFGNTSYNVKDENDVESTVTYVNIFELSVPMTLVQFSNDNGDVTTTLEVSAETDAGIGSFAGKLHFTADEVFVSHSMLGYYTNDGTTKGTWGAVSAGAKKADYTNGRQLTVSYNAENKVSTGASGVYNIVVGMMTKPAVMVEMDLTVTELPYATPQTQELIWDAAQNPARVIFQIGRGVTSADKASQVMLLVLYNKSETEGLMLVRDAAEAQPSSGNVMMLGKKEGDSFTIGFRWNLDNSVEVYIDGEVVGIFPAMDSAVLDARNNWNGQGYGLYIKALSGTTLLQETEEMIDIKATNVSLAYANDFDADAFMALAVGDTGDGDDDGNEGSSEQPVESDPSVSDTVETPGQSNENTEAHTNEATGTSASSEEPGNAGCKSVTSVFSVIGICLFGGVLALFRKKED